MVKTKDSQGGAKSTVTVLFVKEDGFGKWNTIKCGNNKLNMCLTIVSCEDYITQCQHGYREKHGTT